MPTATPEVSLTEVDPRGNGTTIHNEVGCISVNEQILCNSWTQSTIRTDSETTTVKIHAKVDGSNSEHKFIRPGCELTASWPSYYGDVYFKGDDCLYDGEDNIIGCCTQPTLDFVPNPYAHVCEKEYQFWYDQFTIWTDSFPHGDVNALRSGVYGCGVVTKWEVGMDSHDEQGGE
ncbi:hypothetical protein N7491_006261 [Penicillium cf. griseofulvum]|uniref:Uncharacterized protein n=1 Tax=Penicillium cf. griseofulvum TaxID=2972120 RepID=A0A9W9IW81_9EURO|nr:hypothetical protein N7472_010710 [Penicillium cf. griseofulvum]KAJ5429245.1 hypothetical protein N7491_006261 [Penicillium cf. griseofulvum]